MKVYETKNDDIDEGPLDLLTKSGREQRGAFKSGKKTLKATAANLMKEFAYYLGQRGKKSYNQASTQDVVDFLKTKRAKTDDINTNMPMDKDRIAQIFNDKAQAAMRGGDAQGAKEPAFKSQQNQPNPSFKSQRGGDSNSNSQGSGGNPQFKSKRKDPVKKLKLPSQVVSGIQGLTSQQKLQLGQALVKKYGGDSQQVKAKAKPNTIVDKNFDKNQKLSSFGKVGGA